MGTTIFAIVLAYLLGSISFAILVTSLMGVKDPRTYGSGNPGASNVLRSGSKLAAILTLLGDTFKGWLAVILAMNFATHFHFGLGTIALVGLAAFIGHLFPIYHQFKGGKGVATAAGVLLAMNWKMGLAVLGVWLLVALLTRISSLAGIVAAIAAPLIYFSFEGADLMMACIAVMAGLLIWRHKANIDRLIAGSEPKFGQSKKP